MLKFYNWELNFQYLPLPVTKARLHFECGLMKGAAIYDVHRIFSSLSSTSLLFVCKFAAYLDPPPSFCEDVIYGSPLISLPLTLAGARRSERERLECDGREGGGRGEGGGARERDRGTWGPEVKIRGGKNSVHLQNFWSFTKNFKDVKNHDEWMGFQDLLCCVFLVQ